MVHYLLGFAIVFAWILVWGLIDHASSAPAQAGEPLGLGVLLLAAPTLSAWIGLESMERLRPTRLFDVRTRRRLGRFVLGIVAGLLAASATVFLLPLLDMFVPDALLVSVASLLATCFLMMTRDRLRVGFCVACGYDLRDQTAMSRGRCPECGRIGTVVRAKPGTGMSAA